MDSDEKVILIPEYMKKFRCIGTECEDSCCKGWVISLDEKTYKKYKGCKNKEVAPLMQQKVTFNKKDATQSDYGRIKMDSNNACPFLNERELCKIHLNMGESYLSEVCSTYPRQANKIDDCIELSASMSCPEIARIALLDLEPMAFVHIENKFNREFPIKYQLNTKNFDPQKDILYYFWDLRIITISILQDRRYTLYERVVLIGIIYKKIRTCEQENRLSDILDIMELYQQQFDEVEVMKKMIGSKKEEFPFSQEFIHVFINEVVLYSYVHPGYIDCAKKIIEGLQLEKDEEIIKNQYKEVFKKYYDPYMKEKEYVLENYLVNEIFNEIYPFARFESIENSYKMMVTLYNVIVFHLVGMAAFHKGLNDEVVIKMLQSFSRVVLHNKHYLNLFRSE